ncbi:MAG TPA: hypothetical protein VIZ90_11940, partial [Rhizobiaceae bacterium]
SLSLNSVVRFLQQQIPDPVTRKVILVSLILWFAKETGAAVIGLAVGDLLTDEPAISEQDAQQIAEKVQQILEKRVGAKPVREVFRELHKDKSVTGVGVSTKKGDRPRSIVPREQFQERMADPLELTEDQGPRQRTERMILTLISPVLQRNENKWRFLSKDGIIYASIKDQAFLDSILSGQANITMRSGIIILADVEIKEMKDVTKNVWVVTERNVTKVVEIRAEGEAGDLFSQ